MERITFISDGLVLEGRYQGGKLKPQASSLKPSLVICHPHPLFGGSMDNNVVDALEDFSARVGLATLCFNFRGVGQSEGKYDNMKGEVRDVISALNYLAARPEVDPDRLGLMGYSFGGLMAFLAELEIAGNKGSSRSAPGALALISPMAPVGGWKPAGGLPDHFPKTFIVTGDQDRFCPVDSARALANLLGDPAQLLILKGADHFYLGREPAAAGPAAEFMAAVI